MKVKVGHLQDKLLRVIWTDDPSTTLCTFKCRCMFYSLQTGIAILRGKKSILLSKKFTTNLEVYCGMSVE